MSKRSNASMTKSLASLNASANAYAKYREKQKEKIRKLYQGEELKIDDIDEATYYILKGAKLVGVKVRKVAENKTHKLGYTQHWSVYLERISPKAKTIWKSGTAAYPIKEFMAARHHLKQRIKNQLHT